jgi:hypothetical protein
VEGKNRCSQSRRKVGIPRATARLRGKLTRNRIKDEIIKEVFADPKIRGYGDLRSFKPALAVEDRIIDSDGDFRLNIFLADDPEARQDRFNEARDESNARRDDRIYRFEQESSSFNATVVLTQDHCISFDWTKSA